jgi:hypothetical protein
LNGYQDKLPPPDHNDRYFVLNHRVTTSERDYINNYTKMQGVSRQALFSAIIRKMMCDSEFIPPDVVEAAQVETRAAEQVRITRMSETKRRLGEAKNQAVP